MPTIGKTLREARMRQRLDIADVEERTKIRAKYLRALENEEFGMLPGPTFVKTFLRTYAELLGLDPHRLLEDYRARYESGDDVEHIQSLGPPESGPRPAPHRLTGRAPARSCCSWWWLSWSARRDRSAERERRRRRRLGRRPQARPPRRAHDARAGAQARAHAPPPGWCFASLPITPTYVCVDRGAGTPVIFQNTIDSPQTFRGKLVRVNLGKTDVELTKNRRPVPLEPSPEPVGIAFTVRASRPIPLGERPCA